MTTANRSLRVFLCHSSNDKPAVRELYQKLRAEPWISPWLDEEELLPGMDWNMEIEKAIEATDAILVCISNNSITKEGYVQREIRIALDYADYKPDGTLFIIPVRLEECVPPNRLARWQYANYFADKREQGLQRLVTSLKKRADSLDIKFEKIPSKNNSPVRKKSDLLPKATKPDSKQIIEQEPTASILKPSQRKDPSYPNRFGLVILKTLEESIGKDSLHSILKLADLERYIEKYPRDNLDKHFSFAEVSAICSALEDIYGSRGGRGFAHRAGRAIFSDVLKNYGALASAKDMVFTLLPLNAKLRIGLPALARVFSQISDQLSTVEETDNELIWSIHNCPYCWDRLELSKPTCYMFVGLLQESLYWFSGGQEFRINETRCKAMGDQACEFVIQKVPIG